MGTKTIWGSADHSRIITRGITRYSTPSHGGYSVTDRKAKEMNPALLACGHHQDGRYWFEEDCAWSAVVVQWPEFFKDETQHGKAIFEIAVKTLGNWFPDAWEAFFHGKLTGEQSLVRRDQEFAAATRHSFVSQSAWGDWHEKVPAGQVGVSAYRAGDNTESWRLVPVGVYKPPMVVDSYPVWEDHA